MKVKLTLSGMGGELALKLPFTIAHFGEGGADAQDTLVLDDDTNDNGCDTTAGKAINTITTTLPEKNGRPVIMAEVENHQKNNNNTNINYLNNDASCSSPSTSAGGAGSAHPPLTTGIRGQVTRGCEGSSESEIMIPPPMCSALRQRRFSQVRQERIRPADDSLDRIETLPDDGDVGLGDNWFEAASQRRSAERRLTGSSCSLDGTELLDEVFCDTLTITQQMNTSSSTSGRVSVVWEAGGTRGAVEEYQRAVGEGEEERKISESLESTIVAQIHAPQL